MYYGLHAFVPAKIKMTIISNDVLTRLEALKDTGLKPMAIFRQLNLKYETVKKYFQRNKLIAGLPPKIVVPPNPNKRHKGRKTKNTTIAYERKQDKFKAYCDRIGFTNQYTVTETK